MKKYVYESVSFYNHQVFKCLGSIEQKPKRHDKGSHLLVTIGYQGDLIQSDGSLFVDNQATSVLQILTGEDKGKSIVVVDQRRNQVMGVEFLHYMAGQYEVKTYDKKVFQEISHRCSFETASLDLNNLVKVV